MRFEWDENRNDENIARHGLFFEDADAIFDAPLLTEPDTRFDYGETRWVGIGLLGDTIVVVVYTYRGTDTIRIISLRGALTHERNRYEAYLQE